jgi:RNA polymerase sigma factor for flagellar operon FliA
MMPNTSLFARSQSGDLNARAELLKQHVGIVHFVARRLARSLADEAELDELVSAGQFGLLAAVENFDESRGLSFSTFAAARVRGAMLDELRRQDRVPRSVRAKARQINAVRDALANQLGRKPSDRELAMAAGLPLDQLWRWQQDVDRAGQVSLDAPVASREAESGSVGDRLACLGLSPSDEYDREESRERLHEALSRLGTAEQRVLLMYFFEEKPMSEIAAVLGVSESRVSQIRSKALSRLRAHFASVGIRTAAAA